MSEICKLLEHGKRRVRGHLSGEDGGAEGGEAGEASRGDGVQPVTLGHSSVLRGSVSYLFVKPCCRRVVVG